MAGQDVFENQMKLVDNVDYLRGMAGKDSVLISPKIAALQMQDTQNIVLNANTEYDTGISSYGLYQLENYNNGGCALFIISHINSKIVSSIGASFGTVSGEGILSLYRKESNGNIFIRNNTEGKSNIGFRKI